MGRGTIQLSKPAMRREGVIAAAQRTKHYDSDT